MDIIRTLFELIQFFILICFTLVIATTVCLILLLLIIQDSFIFIYKQIKELLWPKKQ